MKEKLGSGGDANRLSKEQSIDSFTSVIFPWRAIPQRPRQVADNQIGREVNPSSFFLCMTAVLLLTTSIGICAAALWAIIHIIPYLYLIDGAVLIGINVFGFCAGILGLPCMWIACTSHDSKKNYTFLPLLMLLLACSLIMLGTSITMGLIYKSQIRCNKTSNSFKLLSTPYRSMLNETLLKSMFKYDMNCKQRKAWNNVQQKLKCCGSVSYQDWINVRNFIPSSCCPESLCKNQNVFSQGCLDPMAMDLQWQVSFCSGLSSIVFFAQMFIFGKAWFMYTKGKLQQETQQSSLISIGAET